MRTIAVVAITICALAGTAAAKVHELPIGGVTLDVPRKWKAKPSQVGMFAETKDGAVKLSIYHIDGADLATEWTDHLGWAGNVLTGGVVGPEREEMIGALTGKAVTVTGTRDGKPATGTLALLATPRGHMVSLFVSTLDGKTKKHQKDLDRMLASLAGRPHRIDDEGYRNLRGWAQAFVEKLATIIEKNDKKGFVAVGGAGLDTKTVMKAKKLTSLLGLPTSGGWHIESEADGLTLWMWRGGVSVDVPMLKLPAADGKLSVVAVTVRSKTVPPAPEVWPASGGYCYDWQYHRCFPTLAACEARAIEAGQESAEYERDVYEVENPDSSPPPCRLVTPVYCRVSDTGDGSCFATQAECEHFGACYTK